MPDRRLTVLVTGGAGFLGSHLCERLLAAGHRVICLDNFQTGQRRNVAPLAGHPGFTLIEHDVIEPLPVRAVDRIFHLACAASPPHYQRDPIHTTRTSVEGTYNALELARRAGARLLLASTSEVYGDPLQHPQREDYRGHVNPVGPRACYDEGKRCAESLCMDYHRRHGMAVKIARLFNTYGPRMHPDDGRVVSNFVVQALGNRPLTVYGEGRQTRSFCYVDDLVDGLLRLMDSAPGFTGPVNLGNPAEISVRELAERVIALTGARSPLVRRPLPADDPAQRRPDITLARRVLGWQPRVDLDTGLRRTIDYFATRLAEAEGDAARSRPWETQEGPMPADCRM